MPKVMYPPFVHWEVTPECNHNCIHCYNYWRKDWEALEDVQRRLMDGHYMCIAKELCKNNAHTVVITGGEPLIVFDDLKEPIQYLHANGVNISINTNATLLSEEDLDFIKENNIGLFISFPCADAEVCDFITNRKGSCKAILAKLDMLHKHDVKFMLNIVASRINLEYIIDTVKFLVERYGIKKIYITRVGKPINSDDSFNQYLLLPEDIAKLQDICVKLHKDYNVDIDTGCPFTMCSINSQESFDLFGYKKICTAGNTSYAVDSYGNLKACPRDGTTYGNILEEDFQTIWDRTEEWKDDSLLPEDCKHCEMKNVCRGGCRVDAAPFTGDLKSMDTTAVLSNLPIKYLMKEENKTKFGNDDRFAVNDVKMVKESFGYRASYQKGYVFITNELAEFISANRQFTVSMLMGSFSVNITIANQVITRLLEKGIIHQELEVR